MSRWRRPGFFDADKRLAALSKKGDPLEAIATLVPWKSFRADIEAVAVTPEAEKKSSAGRKPFDVILMFRMLILQSLYNLSDEQIEYRVRDRIAVIGGERGGVQSRRRGVKCWLASPIVNRIWACSEGIAVSSGIARGTAIVLAYADRAAGSLRRIEASQVEAEIARFETALEKTERDLLVLDRYVQERIRPRESDIFTAQALVMRDLINQAGWAVNGSAPPDLRVGNASEHGSLERCFAIREGDAANHCKASSS